MMTHSMPSNESASPPTPRARARFQRPALLLVTLACLILAAWSTCLFIHREGRILRQEHEERMAEREREQKRRKAKAIRETITSEGGTFRAVKGPGIQLDMTGCNSPDEALSDMIRLTKLEADSLGNRWVSLALGPAFCDRHVHALAEVRNLTYLDLTAATFTEQGIKRLRVYLADDTVIRVSEAQESTQPERGQLRR